MTRHDKLLATAINNPAGLRFGITRSRFGPVSTLTNLNNSIML